MAQLTLVRGRVWADVCDDLHALGRGAVSHVWLEGDAHACAAFQAHVTRPETEGVRRADVWEKIRAGGRAGVPPQTPARKYAHALEQRARRRSARAPSLPPSSAPRAPAAPPKAGTNADDKVVGIAVSVGDIGPGDPNVRTTLTGDIGLADAIAASGLTLASVQRLVSGSCTCVVIVSRDVCGMSSRTFLKFAREHSFPPPDAKWT